MLRSYTIASIVFLYFFAVALWIYVLCYKSGKNGNYTNSKSSVPLTVVGVTMEDLKDAKQDRKRLVYVVKGQTYVYDNVPLQIMNQVIKKGNQTHLFDELVDLLRVFSEACAKCNVQWWLDYGACLGWVRNRAIIPWDDDIDVAVMKADEKRVLSEVGPAMRVINPKMSLRLCRNSILRLVQMPHCYPWIDIFVQDKETDGKWGCYTTKMTSGRLVGGNKRKDRVYRAIPGEKLFPLTETRLHGVKAYVPRDPQFVVEARYGEKCAHEFKLTHTHPDTKVCSRCEEV